MLKSHFQQPYLFHSKSSSKLFVTKSLRGFNQRISLTAFPHVPVEKCLKRNFGIHCIILASYLSAFVAQKKEKNQVFQHEQSKEFFKVTSKSISREQRQAAYCVQLVLCAASEGLLAHYELTFSKILVC